LQFCESSPPKIKQFFFAIDRPVRRPDANPTTFWNVWKLTTGKITKAENGKDMKMRKLANPPKHKIWIGHAGIPQPTITSRRLIPAQTKALAQTNHLIIAQWLPESRPTNLPICNDLGRNSCARLRRYIEIS
jgi:hypothetical protein